MRIKNSFIILLLIVMCTACNKQTKYHSYSPIPIEGWEKSDTIFFSLPKSFELNKYDLIIGLRHSDNYRYKNIWLEIGNNCKDSIHFEKDTIQMLLADKNNNWIGSGIGGMYQIDNKLPKTIELNQKCNSLKFYITQIMTDNPLLGINDIGIQLIKTTY